jgi:hypothetical protein
LDAGIFMGIVAGRCEIQPAVVGPLKLLDFL